MSLGVLVCVRLSQPSGGAGRKAASLGKVENGQVTLSRRRAQQCGVWLRKSVCLSLVVSKAWGSMGKLGRVTAWQGDGAVGIPFPPSLAALDPAISTVSGRKKSPADCQAAAGEGNLDPLHLLFSVC